MTKQQRLLIVLALFLVPGIAAVLFNIHFPHQYSSNKILAFLHEVVIPLGLISGPALLPLVVLEWWNAKQFLKWIEKPGQLKHVIKWLVFLVNLANLIYVGRMSKSSEIDPLDPSLIFFAVAGVFLSIFLNSRVLIILSRSGRRNHFLNVLFSLPFAISLGSLIVYFAVLWTAVIRVSTDALLSIPLFTPQ